MKYQRIVMVEPRANRELGALEFIGHGNPKDNIVFFLVEGDTPVPLVLLDDLVDYIIEDTPVDGDVDPDDAYDDARNHLGDNMVDTVSDYYISKGFIVTRGLPTTFISNIE